MMRQTTDNAVIAINIQRKENLGIIISQAVSKQEFAICGKMTKIQMCIGTMARVSGYLAVVRRVEVHLTKGPGEVGDLADRVDRVDTV